MRYWIYWNDLIQGPFELEELSVLKALSEDLPVCLEDRADWLPACRVADLAPVIDQLRTARMPPPLPPPPPSGPPLPRTVQGEFFTQAPEQESLFPTPGALKGPFALQVVDAPLQTLLDEVRYTAPIRFRSGDYFAPPQQTPRDQPAQPFGVFPPESVRSIEASFAKDSPVAALTEPAPEMLASPHIPLEIYPEFPETFPATAPLPVAPAAAGEDLSLPPLNVEPAADPSSFRLAGWIVGILAALLLTWRLGYKWFDSSTSQAAIAESKKHLPAARGGVPTVPIPIVAVPPLPPAAPTKPHKRTKKIKRPATTTVAPAVIFPVEPPKPAAPVESLPPPAQAAAPKKNSRSKKLIHVAAPATTAAAVAPSVVAAPVSAATVPPATGLVIPPIPSLAESKPATVVPVATPIIAAPAMTSTVKPLQEDPWLGRHNDAITLVMNKKISRTGQTVNERARVMLEEMHDKELIHAAETGERLYLPDKISWTALRESGALYRVYMGFSALQANGERVQSLSYQFHADLAHHAVSAEDPTTLSDFLNAAEALHHKRDPRAADIENMLSAVDLLNKHKMRAIIVKNSRKNRAEEKNIIAAIKAATLKFQRAIAYARTKYPEALVQNVAHAYEFTALLNEHV